MRAVRPLDANDVDAAVAIRVFAQWGRDDDSHRQRVRDNLPRTLGSFEDGVLAAVAVMLDLDVNVAGAPAVIGGLAGVTTAPTQRRRGHVAALLRTWFQRLHERGIGLSAEFPFDPSFYARYGYQTLANGTALEVPTARLAAWRRGADGARVRYDAVELGPARWGDLVAIHDAYAGRFSLALRRSDASRDHWRSVLAPAWSSRRYHAFLMQDAYVVLTIDDPDDGPGHPKALVRDMAYATPAGRAAVLALLADLDGQVDSVRIHLPPGDPLLTMWRDRYPVESVSVQARVVDVVRALAPLRSDQEAGFTLHLRDSDCPWNDGSFAVELTPAGCSVVPSSRSGPNARQAVSLDVNALAAVLFGAVDPAAALATGLADGDLAPLVQLGRLLAGHPTFVAEADHF